MSGRRRTQFGWRLLAGLVAVTVLAGCAPATAQRTGPSPAGSAVQVRGSPAPTPTSTAPSSGPVVGASCGPEGSPPQHGSPIRAARTDLAEYGCTSVPRRVWWAQLSPQLSPNARPDYDEMGPPPVGFSRLRPGGRVIAAPTPDLVLVEVGTNGGIWWVLLTRSRRSAAWLIDRITPAPYDES